MAKWGYVEYPPPVSGQLLFHIPYAYSFFQPLRLDMAEHKKGKPCIAVADSLFMVRSWDMVQLGLLSLHRLALAGQEEPRPAGAPLLLHKISSRHSPRHRPRRRTGGRYNRRSFPSRPLHFRLPQLQRVETRQIIVWHIHIIMLIYVYKRREIFSYDTDKY